ncbi:MAG TPA: hypothetical protein DEF51_17275 [Myxococcales bacterium]|nr:hypothetical protein [Myxococcales bacterium]
MRRFSGKASSCSRIAWFRARQNHASLPICVSSRHRASSGPRGRLRPKKCLGSIASGRVGGRSASCQGIGSRNHPRAAKDATVSWGLRTRSTKRASYRAASSAMEWDKSALDSNDTEHAARSSRTTASRSARNPSGSTSIPCHLQNMWNVAARRRRS